MADSSHILVSSYDKDSSCSIGYCFALFMSKPLIGKLGRLNSVLLMYVLLALSMLTFGFAQSDPVFIFMSVLSRLSEGVATSFNISTLMTMISAYYSDNASFINAEVFGVLLSTFLGPLWGGLLFDALGYSGIFLVETVTILLIALMLCYF